MAHRQSRRSFVRSTGVGLLGFWVGGCRRDLTPAQAREESVPFTSLDAGQVRTLEAYGEILLPGSAAAGLAHFVDHQLGAPPREQMLMIKYLGVEPPFLPFYAGGLAAIDGAALAGSGTAFHELAAADQANLAGQVAQGNPGAWAGPPAPLFHFVIRNDAIDVVYGTVEGMERLGLPYMAHITPPSRWGE